MFNFLDKIFSKFISLVASAIIAVGIVSVPELAVIQTPQIDQLRQEIVAEQIQGNETQEIGNETSEQIKETTKKDQTQTISQSQTASVATILPEAQELSSSPTPDSTPTPTPTSTLIPTSMPTAEIEPQQEQVALEILSVSITTTIKSASIEWKTNIPTNSKIFISGNGISSKVYSSQSGLSTRHIANVTGLSSNTTYSYEIEAIIDNQVVKKQGSFLTKPGNISIELDKTSVQLTAWNYVRITAQYTENGTPMPVEIYFSTPDESKTYYIVANDFKPLPTGSIPCGSLPLIIRSSNSNEGGTCSSDGKVEFRYTPKSLGTHIITVSAKGVTKTVNLEVVPYVKIDPEIIDVVNSNCNPDCSTKPVLKRNTNYLSGKSIGYFSISEADEPTRVGGTEIEFESDIKENSYFTVTCQNTHCGAFSNGKGVVSGGDLNAIYNSPFFSYFITIWNTKDYVGSHTFTIKSIKVLGMGSGEYRYVLGLPVTFTFEITE